MPTESYRQACRAHLEASYPANYSQDQIGPKFAVAMDPLRRYLREGDAGFPLTHRGLEGVERLKRQDHVSFRAR